MWFQRPPNSFKPEQTAPPFVAELTGEDTATACGVRVRSSSPVLALCRSLIAAGLTPDQSLIVYRKGTEALRIRSIGEASQLEINSKGTGFVWARAVRAGSPMRVRPISDAEGGEAARTSPLASIPTRQRLPNRRASEYEAAGDSPDRASGSLGTALDAICEGERGR